SQPRGAPAGPGRVRPAADGSPRDVGRDALRRVARLGYDRALRDSSGMALLDRLRRRPRWEDPDPKVRAEGVREIPAEEQDRLSQIARDDADPLVRRAAVRRLKATDVLARLDRKSVV